MLARLGRLPDEVVACVGGGSNAMGLFHAFRDDPVRLIGVEAAGDGLDTDAPRRLAHARPPRRAARLVLVPAAGRLRPGARGALDLGRPGLPGRGARARLAQRQRPRRYAAATDAEALAAFSLTRRARGHHPGARERPRPGLRAARPGPETRFAAGDVVVVNLSGRGDKDVHEVARLLDHPGAERGEES